LPFFRNKTILPVLYGRHVNEDDQIQADDGQVIFTRSAAPNPMPNGETAPQADGQIVTVANIDQITKGDGDGQKVSSHLTLSGQRSLKEQVQERVARIQADVSTFKDEQLRLADDLFWWTRLSIVSRKFIKRERHT
jgi:hypothetical protein